MPERDTYPVYLTKREMALAAVALDRFMGSELRVLEASRLCDTFSELVIEIEAEEKA